MPPLVTGFQSDCRPDPLANGDISGTRPGLQELPLFPVFANVTRGNAKKVKAKAYPFYFAMTPDTKRQVFFTHFRRWGSGAALPGRVPALKRRGLLQDLREISGASVGSMAAEELEAIGSDPAVAGPIEEGKSVLEKLLRSEAFDCPQKPLFDPIKAQEAAAEIVKGMAVSGRHRRADGRTGRAGQSLTGRCRLCSAGYPNRMHSVQTYLRCALLLPALFGCTRDPLAAATTEPLGGNVLIILSDDIGIDKTAIYGEHPTPPATPII